MQGWRTTRSSKSNSRQMKISLAQLNSNDEISDNLKTVIELIKSAKSNGSEIIIFPENTLFFRIISSEKVQAIRMDGPEIGEISKCCQEQNIAVHLTTPIEEDGEVYNASVIVSRDGRIKKLYDKMHLFDIELKGQVPIRESDSFKHGAEPQIFEFGGFKFGSSICYDVRFAELYNWYAKKEVDVILIPSAFLVKTGKAHWEVLLRARAIESQCYVLAPAQSGIHLSKNAAETRETYGHSMAINPWGEVLEKKAEGVGLLNFELKQEEIHMVRRQIPMSKHRRKF